MFVKCLDMSQERLLKNIPQCSADKAGVANRVRIFEFVRDVGQQLVWETQKTHAGRLRFHASYVEGHAGHRTVEVFAGNACRIV
jgi:hypothetical protein